MDDLSREIAAIQGRIVRLLDSGWRDASHEALLFAEDADRLEALGAVHIADRLRAVAVAATPGDALRAMAIAANALDLLRARLELPDPADPGAMPWPNRKTRARSTEKLYPLCRMLLGDQECWSCLRARGGSIEWVLVEPSPDANPRWLRDRLDAHLRWSSIRPFDSGKLTTYALLEHERGESENAVDAAVDAILEAARSGSEAKAAGYLIGGGTLSIVPVEQEPAAAWLTIDPAHDDLIQRVAGNDVFALVRTKSNESTPFALVRKGRFLKKSHVIHLVPGLPEDDAG